MSGGIEHAADCLAAYLRRNDRDAEKLVDYAVGLGFLAEHLSGGTEPGRI